ncbi:MAG: hypothetical protein U0271_03435 [Polyangiaceae bacterium]
MSNLPPLALEPLARLATSAGLVWALLTKPRTIASIPFLIPAIGKIVPEQNFNLFKLRYGLDPRQLHEAILLSYDDVMNRADAQLIKHTEDPAAVEKCFFARLTSDAQRHEDRPDAVRIVGTIGRTEHAFTRLGRETVCFQQGGDPERGPARIASLMATNALTRTPKLLDAEPLASLYQRFGDAPAIGLALGPFDDEWKKAARGLLEVATAVGAAARPTSRENLGFAIAITGDWGDRGAKAAETLRGAWDDFATTTMGHLLSLDRPVGEPLAAGDRSVITLSVEIAPDRFADGLKAVLETDLEAIMRLD